jgi:uncharacterized protein (TIGR02246 family)
MKRRMPATSPGEIHELFQAAFNAGDTPAVLALYEPGAVFVTGPGVCVAGHEAIGKVFEALFALKPVMRLETASILENGDLALLEGRWVWAGASREGDPMQITGTSREVVRRQSDGSWLYCIDDPGSER